MVLLHDIIEILALTNMNAAPVFRIVADNCGSICPILVDGDFLRHAIAANGFHYKPLRGPLITASGQQKVNRVARFIDSSMPIHPLPLEPNIRFVKTPAAPDQSLPRVEIGFELWTVFARPPANGKVFDIDAALF